MIKQSPLPNGNHPILSPICPMGVADTLGQWNSYQKDLCHLLILSKNLHTPCCFTSSKFHHWSHANMCVCVWRTLEGFLICFKQWKTSSARVEFFQWWPIFSVDSCGGMRRRGEAWRRWRLECSSSHSMYSSSYCRSKHDAQLVIVIAFFSSLTLCAAAVTMYYN